MKRVRVVRPHAKWRLSLILLLAAALLAVGAPAAFAAGSSEQTEEVKELLEQYHLSKPTDAELGDKEIDEMVEALHDPYTEYFDADEWKSFNSSLEQTFVGIGIVMTDPKEDYVYVQDVIAGSPAEAAGVAPGDRLDEADGKSLKGLSTVEIQKQLRGEENTSVKLAVSRADITYTFDIVRKSVHLPTVTTRLLGDKVGYLSLSGFTSDSGEQVKTKLDELEKQGIASLVFDLRDNGGGYVSAAQTIAGLFVKNGVLAHMEDRDGVDHPLEVSGGAKTYPVTILVNGNSASASELLSGALQDYGVAKLVGTRTYGKGVVQSLIELKSGGMLKVTIQQYFTPKGRKVDKVGLMPDVLSEGEANQLVDAYVNAGGKKVVVTGTTKGILTVNGLREAQPSAVVRNAKGVWYVNLRLAAAMAGIKLTYDAKKHEFGLSNGSSFSRTLSTTDSHVQYKDGKALVDVRLLAKWIPGFAFSANGDTVKMASGL